MVKRNDFTFHAKEWNDCISSMTDEELGILCRRMTEYALGSDSDEEIPDIAVSFSWKLIRAQMESDFEREDKTTSNKRKAAKASAKARNGKSKDEPEVNIDEGDSDSDISDDDSNLADSDFENAKDDFANAEDSKTDSAHAEKSRNKSAHTKISRKKSAHAENNLQNSVSSSDSLISQTDKYIYNNLNLNNMSDSQSDISSKSLNTNINVNMNVAIGVPSLQEVQNYCKSQNLIINPDKFYEYYSDRQWTTGGIPIHNWQRLIMRWNENEWIPSVEIADTNKGKIPPRCAKAHNFTERDYDFDMLQNKLLAIG